MDIKLNFIEKGSGKPLVLLHGNGGSLDCFKNQIEYFSKYYRVIALDTRGHGNSPRGSAPFTIEQFSEDLKCFLDENNLKNIYKHIGTVFPVLKFFMQKTNVGVPAPTFIIKSNYILF